MLSDLVAVVADTLGIGSVVDNRNLVDFDHSCSYILPNYFDNLGSTAVDNIGHKVVVVAVARVDLVEAESQAVAAVVAAAVVENENRGFLAFDFVRPVAAAALAVLEAVVAVAETLEVVGRDFDTL